MANSFWLRAPLVGLFVLAGGCAAESEGASSEEANVAAANGAAGANVPTAIEAFDDTDNAAFGYVKQAVTLGAAQHDGIWKEASKSYDLSKIPLYLVRRSATIENQRGYLLQHPTPHGTPISAPAFAELGAIYRYDDEIKALGEENFLYDEPISGKPTFVFPYRPASSPPSEEDSFDPSIPSSDEFFFLLIHEAFHRYQEVEGNWKEPAGWTQEEANYPFVRENLALAMLENKVLAAGIQAGDNAAKEAALKQLIAIRKARIAAPWAVVNGVNYIEHMDVPQEWSEGTANYAELHFSDLAHKYPSGITPIAVKNLEEALALDQYQDQQMARDEYAWGRFYYSGSAIGLLLDAVGGIDWRSGCSEAQGPYDSALKRFPDVGDAAALVAAAKAAQGYDTALLPLADKFLALPPGDPSQNVEGAVATHRRSHRPKY